MSRSLLWIGTDDEQRVWPADSGRDTALGVSVPGHGIGERARKRALSR